MIDDSTTTCIFGASPGTGNQGVNALFASTLSGLAARGCTDVHVFGYGGDTRTARLGSIPYTLHGITVGKRVWRARHLARARLWAAAGLRNNPVVRTVARANLVLDASGGDSFTDLYGDSRFRQIIAPKRIALDTGRPLVLLPQTYGPFTHASSRRVARHLVEGARLAYARDADSYGRLKELLGDHFDPARHRLGVDLAFGLAAGVDLVALSFVRDAADLERARELTPQERGEAGESNARDFKERLADHATNIAEEVIYLIEGEIVRHAAYNRE